jgi:hypothetical protein
MAAEVRSPREPPALSPELRAAFDEPPGWAAEPESEESSLTGRPAMGGAAKVAEAEPMDRGELPSNEAGEPEGLSGEGGPDELADLKEPNEASELREAVEEVERSFSPGLPGWTGPDKPEANASGLIASDHGP